MSCRSIRPWLHVESNALDEADRLVLEEHLQGCARCRDDRERLAIACRVGASMPAESIGPRGYGRAIARALMAGPREPTRSHGRARWWTLAIAATGTAAIIAWFVIRSGGADSSGPTASSEHLSLPAAPAPDPGPLRSSAPPPDVAVVEGTLSRDGVAVPAPAELPANVTLRAATSVRVLAYRVSVIIAASSQIRWAAVERTLVLEAGSVEVDGDAVRIATERFRVDVNGAATITTRSLSVRHGTATVIGADGSVLVPRLEAGASWTLPEPLPAVAKPSVQRLLAQARAAFTRLDHAGAERYADAALDAGPSRAQAAEARTILAECALAAGRLDDALNRYEAIAARFGDLLAGETALFSAARLEARRGHTDAARALFERYLDRYPTGRFADDARRHTLAPR
jgi:TolA-binding protein